jgi:hypothetical protein
VIDPRSLHQPRPTVEPAVSLEDLRLVQLVDLACALEGQLAVHLLGMIYAGGEEEDGRDGDSS